MTDEVLLLTSYMKTTLQFITNRRLALESELNKLNARVDEDLGAQSCTCQQQNYLEKQIHELSNAFYQANIIIHNAKQMIAGQISNTEREYLFYINKINQKYSFKVEGLVEFLRGCGIEMISVDISTYNNDLQEQQNFSELTAVSIQQATLYRPESAPTIFDAESSVLSAQCIYENGCPILPKIAPDQ